MGSPQLFDWHAGELRLRKFFDVPNTPNLTNPFLTDTHADTLRTVPLLVLGTLDANSRPWTSIMGSTSSSNEGRGFMVGLEDDQLAVSGRVALGDPILSNLQQRGGTAMVSGLGMDLGRRKRVKIFGSITQDARSVDAKSGTVTMRMEVSQTIGNCPKYITTRILRPVPSPTPVPLAESTFSDPAPPEVIKQVIHAADHFYLSTRNRDIDMDTNHRGGPSGFVRLLPDCTTLVWPEYPGNQYYSNLGNLQFTPLAGLTFPNFVTGDVLYLTGEARVLLGEDADALLPGTRLAVEYRITGSRCAKGALPLHDVSRRNEASPYNLPLIRLASEIGAGETTVVSRQDGLVATLRERTLHTGDIATFTFRLNHRQQWKAGQHVLLDCSKLLGEYSAPVIKSFTVSSAPPAAGSDGSDDFEITIRKVGVATATLFDISLGTEIRVAGFAGEFIPGIVGTESQKEIRFIAGGLGITPFLAVVASKRNAKLRLWWAVRDKDLAFMKWIVVWLQQNGVASDSIRLFVSGDDMPGYTPIDSICQIQRRRMSMEDLDTGTRSSSRVENHWWVCAPDALRDQVLGWVTKIGGIGEWEIFAY